MKTSSKKSTVEVAATSGSYRFISGQREQHTLEGDILLVRAVVDGKEYRFSDAYAKNNIPSGGKVKEVEIRFSIHLSPSSINCNGVTPKSLVAMYEESFKEKAQQICSSWLKRYDLKMSKKRVCKQVPCSNSHCSFVVEESY